jgi:hypothetical protein
MKEEQLLNIVTGYFKEKIFDNHKINSLQNHTKLKSYKLEFDLSFAYSFLLPYYIF